MNIATIEKIPFGEIKEHVLKLFSKTWIVCLFTLILMAFILFYRKPDAFLNPQFWAEDGVIFFKQNIEYGLKSVTIPYAGYLHSVPRMIAFIASWFPVSMAPAIYNYFALALMLLAAGSLFSSRCFIPLKPLVALSIVLVPHSGEVFMNITSVQWFLCLLILILLCKDPPYKLYHYLFDYLIIIICGLTGPFIIFLLPLFFVRSLIKKSTHNYGTLFVAFLCALIQEWFIINTFRSTSNSFSGDINAWINLFGIKLFTRLFLIEKIYNSINPVILAICSLVLPIVLIWFTNTKKQLYLIVSFLFLGLAVMLSALYKHRGTLDLFVNDIKGGDRYSYLFYLMIMWSLVTYLDSKNILKRQIATVLILLIIVSSAQYFRSFKYVDYNWKQYSEKIESGVSVRVPINPPGWFIKLGSVKNNPDNDATDSNENNIRME